VARGGAARRRCSAYTFPAVAVAVAPVGLREHGRGREGRDELPPAEGRGHQTGGGSGIQQGSGRRVVSGLRR